MTSGRGAERASGGRMGGDIVAYLEVQLDDCDQDETQRQIEIRGNQEFYLGRNSALCQHYWSDRSISNRHVRIHCVLYEQDPVAGIPPLVYAADVSTNGTYLKKSNVECASSQGRGIRMGRKSGSFLLDEGDELRISDSVTLIYHSLVPVQDTILNPVQQREQKLFASRYLITGRILGEGGYGKVMVAIHQKTQRQLACKVIDLRHLYTRLPPHNLNLSVEGSQNAKRWPSRVSKCFREFNILKHLNHPNVISLHKVFWSPNSIYILQELVTGGDLFSYIEYKGGCLCDVEAAVIVRQVLKGVEYLHEHRIVHRDLKPDNVLMTSLDDGARVVITDFGNARFFPKESSTMSGLKSSQRQRMYSLAGTYEFTAPEIHKVNKLIPAEHGYSKAVDMWSVGCITAALLSGDALFTDRTHPAYERHPGRVILSLASKCDLGVLDDESHQVWRAVGSRPKQFIKNLLVLEEKNRMTATEALAHPWFSNKHHAPEFDALYEQATRHWQPRRKIFRLVESISKVTATSDLTTNDLPEEFLSQEVVSRYFAPPASSTPAYDIRGSLAVSQPRRANTILPAILEVHEESQSENSDSAPQSHYNHSGVNDYHVRRSHRESIGESMGQLSLDPEPEGGHFRNDDGSREYFDEYGCAMDPQEEAFGSLLPPKTPEREGDFEIVRETPCTGGRRRQMSSTYDAYDEVSESTGYFAQDASKRRKLHS
ncbi:kinase-like domain-containing protein [Clohesyomyces aquaticus]|uniref:Kinase-like domain-containing protein n=1 Tax=Clohesyomyces aquaticus TaxID=1231657 RepID=A0A1Y1ZHZ8_9PLEO|nr:kinase-like domain-containing protein [Clohesyomyces aquaticus]